MSIAHLGAHFDIHGGGVDLKFPHHENEIAQSEAATGEHFVNYWMHNGHVRVDDEKMAKSLGNFTTIRDVLAAHPAEAVRLFLLSTHYRSPLNFNDTALESARAGLERLYTALRGLPDDAEALPSETDAETESWTAQFLAAMDDDFNTPLALSVLFDLAREMNRHREVGNHELAASLGCSLRRLGQVIGLLGNDAERFLQGRMTGRSDDAARIDALVAEREAARANRDFVRADEIRATLLAEGVVLEDSAGGTTWRRSAGGSTV